MVESVSYLKSRIEEVEEGEIKLTANLLEMENALVVLFNEEGRMRLGTLAVATPLSRGDVPSVSSVLLGDRNIVLTRVLAEHFATALNKLALVSTHVREAREIGPPMMRLANKLIRGTG